MFLEVYINLSKLLVMAIVLQAMPLGSMGIFNTKKDNSYVNMPYW